MLIYRKRPMVLTVIKLLAASFHLGEAVAAINRSVLSGLKRDLALLAAGCTDRGKHLASLP